MAAKPTEKRSAPSGRVSMHDVASLVGLSRSAVSLALSGHPSIPTPTKDRVQAAAERIGYRKNPLVAALMSVRRTGANGTPTHATLAFLTSHVAPDSWRQAATHRRFHAAAQARAAERGYKLEEFSLGAPAMRPERLADLLKARGISGLLVAPLPGDQTTLPFDVGDFCIVGLGTSVTFPAIDRVADDHFYGAKLAFEQSLALGYRRIGLALPANVSRRLDHRWWSGYLVAQQQMPATARIPALMPETRGEIPPALNAWIVRHRLDAVIFSIREQELMSCAPADVGLVSLSVHDSTGKVAGVRQNERRVGEDAIELLIEKLHRWETGPGSPPRLHLLHGSWSAGLSAPSAGRKRRALIDAPSRKN